MEVGCAKNSFEQGTNSSTRCLFSSEFCRRMNCMTRTLQSQSMAGPSNTFLVDDRIHFDAAVIFNKNEYLRR